MINAGQKLKDVLSAIETLGDSDARVPLALQNLMQTQLMGGHYDDAKGTAERCLKVTQEHFPDPRSLARAYNNLAVVERRRGQFDRAKELNTAAVAACKELGLAGNVVEAVLELNAGVLHAHRSDWVEADRHLRSGLKLLEADDSNRLLLGSVLNNLGVVAYKLHNFDEADPFFKRAATVWERTPAGPDMERIAISRSNLAALFRTMQHFATAEALMQESFRVWDRDAATPSTESSASFSSLLDAPGTNRLQPVDLIEDPLTIDPPDPLERFSEYTDMVRVLRSGTDEERKPDAAAQAALRVTVEKLGPWYHNIEIRPGLTTNPVVGDHPRKRWEVLAPFVPSDLSGKSVLDIGCNAGYFSLAMKRRGAERVVGIDIMPYVLAQARFLSTWFDLPIQLREMDTYDVDKLGSFDFVLFIGVLYHLKHPLYALEKIAAACKDTMLFQSFLRGSTEDFEPKEDYPMLEASIFDLPEYPKMYFIEKSFNGDISNWWFATRSCLTAMLRTVGFREIIPTDSPDTFICRK